MNGDAGSMKAPVARLPYLGYHNNEIPCFQVFSDYGASSEYPAGLVVDTPGSLGFLASYQVM